MGYGSLKPAGYRKRVFDSLLEKALDVFPAIEVAGPMWCGKTWTSLAHGESVTQVGREAVRKIISADPAIGLEGAKPHVIDEWQDVPALWGAVKDAVDNSGGEAGSYILTGSSSLKKDAVAHSGAGRIARYRMFTMSLYEKGVSDGSVSLQDLFDGKFVKSPHKQGLLSLASDIYRGGWPGLLGKTDNAVSRYLDSYMDAVFSVNIEKRGLDARIARRVFESLARNNCTSAKLATIAEDARLSGSLAWQKQQASEYIVALKSLYLIDEVPGWDAPIRSKSRLRTSPKRYLSDPSLAVAALGVNAERLLEDGQLLGMLFENLCMHDLMVYASNMEDVQNVPVRYYHDADGLEVDAIIELRDGRWAAFEIKLGENKVPEAIRSLDRLEAKIVANEAARNRLPEFKAVVIGASEYSYKDEESGTYIVPITSLCP